MDSVIHNRKNIYHTIIHFNNILIIKRISMIDSSKKCIYHTFISKKGHLSFLYCIYFSVALGEIIHLKTYECTLYRMITCIWQLNYLWGAAVFL